MPKRTSVTPNEISLLITPLLYCVGPMRSWALRGHPCPQMGDTEGCKGNLADYMQMQLRIDHLVAPTGFEPVLPP